VRSRRKSTLVELKRNALAALVLLIVVSAGAAIWKVLL
jgi:hypothetical protein